MNPINTLRGQNAEFSTVTAGGDTVRTLLVRGRQRAIFPITSHMYPSWKPL
jgi:hypothetical protein